MKFQIRNWYQDTILITVDIDAMEETDQSVKLKMAVQEAYRIGASLEQVRLDGVNFENASLRRANVFYKADLLEANLSNADLREADFRDARLYKANFSGADLSSANLSGTWLEGANFKGTNLDRVNFEGANFWGVDLRGSRIGGATLRRFKADYWMALTQNRAEVPGLIAALYHGRIRSFYKDHWTNADGFCGLMGTFAKLRGGGDIPPEDEWRRPAEQWFEMLELRQRPGDDTAAGYAARMAVEWALEWCACSGVKPPEAPTHSLGYVMRD